MMLTSATSSTVKMAAKSQKVVITDDSGMSEMAATVGRRSWIVQGYRPTSATAQPASEQTHIRGTESMATQWNQRARSSFSGL